MDAWIPIISTIIGVVLGAFLSILSQHLQFRRQQTAESNRLRLSKLEELYETFSDIRQRYICNHTQQSHLAIPSEFARAISAKTEAANETPIPFSRMQMLITMYAPELKQHIDAINSVREKLGDIYVETISADTLKHEEREALWKRSCEEADKMEQALDAACKSVAEISIRIIS